MPFCLNEKYLVCTFSLNIYNSSRENQCGREQDAYSKFKI